MIITNTTSFVIFLIITIMIITTNIITRHTSITVCVFFFPQPFTVIKTIFTIPRLSANTAQFCLEQNKFTFFFFYSFLLLDFSWDFWDVIWMFAILFSQFVVLFLLSFICKTFIMFFFLDFLFHFQLQTLPTSPAIISSFMTFSLVRDHLRYMVMRFGSLVSTQTTVGHIGTGFSIVIA
ncbi:hypothetical protein B0J18DRAFT_206742 [Chaetomium sp. MPI-SDFR-AT-0129]|nr:hypothetical protein B0J18DRAFT_206742 [Chaetomium sp. MPI-SDFR-AT-0129]